MAAASAIALLAIATPASGDDLAARAGLSFDAQVATFAQLAEDAQTAIDARDAEAILAGITLPRQALVRTARATPRRIPKPADDSAGLAAIARQQAGSADGIILTWQQRLGGDFSLGNVIGLRHASGPVDAQVQLTGRLPLAHGGPLALSYEGSAWVRVLPPLTLGAVAHGPLGTLGALHPGAAGQSIGPDARLALPGLGGALAAETGWRIPLGADAAGKPVQPGEFHWKLTFQKKL
ncbi:MAG: hypothetical protein KGN34_09935 [Sphingomonadales bacterium]|nr:hypothetical protein [Sphingomonadales bacterium]